MRYLFEGRAYSNIVPDKFTFSKFFIQRYTFYLLIFLWTDTKLIVNLKLKEKFRRWKKPESFMITRAKISVLRASEAWQLFEGGTYNLTFSSQMRRLFEGGAYSNLAVF